MDNEMLNEHPHNLECLFGFHNFRKMYNFAIISGNYLSNQLTVHRIKKCNICSKVDNGRFITIASLEVYEGINELLHLISNHNLWEDYMDELTIKKYLKDFDYFDGIFGR